LADADFDATYKAISCDPAGTTGARSGRFRSGSEEGDMGDQRPLAIGRLWLAASALLVAAASPVLADPNCWTDVSPNECPDGGWHVLQFKNGCSGGEKSIDVCLRWTSGPSSGVVTRFASFANGGGIAEFHPGPCDNGVISYNYQYDGGSPDCPTQ
jgi:hypothetical protein